MPKPVIDGLEVIEIDQQQCSALSVGDCRPDLGDLVRAGKIRYYGLSVMPAWLAMKAATIASERRVPGPIAMQLEYSLVARDVQGEHFPVAREGGKGIMPWSPLAGGFLTGKYRRESVWQLALQVGENGSGHSHHFGC